MATVDVTVINPIGSDTLVGAFTYDEAPILDSVSPATGTTAGGETVTLTGSHFTADVAVTFDGIPAASVVFLSDTMIEVVTPAHAEGAVGVEFFTGGIVDLPGAERAAELEHLSDAVRMASKLRLVIALGGGLGYRSLRQVLAAAPAAQRVVVGRAALARAVLVGLDRAVRDLRDLVA